MKSQPQNWVVLLAVLFGLQAASAPALRHVQVRVADGVLEGVVSADDQVRTFKGIPCHPAGRAVALEASPTGSTLDGSTVGG